LRDIRHSTALRIDVFPNRRGPMRNSFPRFRMVRSNRGHLGLAVHELHVVQLAPELEGIPRIVGHGRNYFTKGESPTVN
jgi:hypothetical protein